MSDSRNVPLPTTEDSDYWDIDGYYDALDSREVPCPRCKGTGLDRWEEDDCTTCFGDGTVQNDLPILPRIG